MRSLEGRKIRSKLTLCWLGCSSSIILLEKIKFALHHPATWLFCDALNWSGVPSNGWNLSSLSGC
jgi:hypothetical protein